MAIKEAQQKVSDTLKQYTDLASKQGSIADILKQKALAAYEDNKDIVEPLDKATATYYQAPSEAREKYQGIFNPFTREKLVSQYTTNQALPMQMYANIYGNRMGRIDDLIGAGTNAFNSQVTAAEGAYKGAQEEYKNAIELEKLALEREKMNQSSSGIGALTDILPFIKYFQPSPTQETKSDDAAAALSSIGAVKQLKEQDPKSFDSALKLASFAGGKFAGFSPTAFNLNKNLTNIRDILTRVRTGAALNNDEQVFYNDFVNNPLGAMTMGGRSIDTSFGILEGIFNKAQQRGTNPYDSILTNMLDQVLGVTGNSGGWERVE